MKAFLIAILLIAQAAVFINAQRTWGDTTSRSVFVSVDIAEDSRGGNVIVTTNRTISTEPYIIRGIRATDLNGTGGDILFLNPSTGLGQTFLNVRVTSQMGSGFSWRFDIFVNSAYTKSISIILMIFAILYVKIMS
ncbi:hypothetical protein PVAND_017648 [Polypedilum vanderplanki]|uniref:Salivary secreted peptide n=1 Tax=Polypedilum vanderplanki TaxID=319348 RepID=A0A9J6B9L0_POLVA|nr:hypothetical protein PVAND_017648 [Polypedilum vanderplanki]